MQQQPTRLSAVVIGLRKLRSAGYHSALIFAVLCTFAASFFMMPPAAHAASTSQSQIVTTNDIMMPVREEVTTSIYGIGANEGRTVPSLAAAKAYSGCWAVHTRAAKKNILGKTLYTFWQTTQVCVRHHTVTSVKVTMADGETKTPGWRIARRPDRSTYNAGFEGRGLARYHFVLGVGGYDVQHPVDCLQLRLKRDGHHYRHSFSCDLA